MAAKKEFWFSFKGEKQRAACTREYIAAALRTYRRNSDKFVLTRIGLNRYEVSLRGSDGRVVAEIRPQ